MDINQLHHTIQESLQVDPDSAASLHLANDSSNDGWSINSDRLLHLDNRIFVLNANDLQLQVLQYHHDHLLAGHFRQNCMLELIH
jgi:hypothetical protein